MMTIREYATRAGVSYEAARVTVKQYREELGEHLYKQGRVQYLDDEGAAILDRHRAPRPLVISTAAYDQQLDELRAENERLKDRLLEAQELVISLQGRVLEAEKAAAVLPAAQADREWLASEAERLRGELEAEKERAAQAEARAQDAEQRRPWWSRLFGRKEG